MKFSSRFSFFSSTLFFHRSARRCRPSGTGDDVFLSSSVALVVITKEEEEKATAFSSMHSKSSKETEDNVVFHAGRVQNERMVLEKLLVGGLFQSENDDDAERKRK